jgi:hypothetical protein
VGNTESMKQDDGPGKQARPERTTHNIRRVAYNDFFTLWKEANPDISILKQAKAEYAKLQ